MSKNDDALRLTDDQLADAVPDGAVIIEREGQRNLVGMTRAQLHEFAKSIGAIGATPEPLFFYRPVCDGEMYEGPIWAKSVGAQMRMAEHPPGTWVPLYAADPNAVELQKLRAENEAQAALLKEALEALEWAGHRGALVAAIRQHLEGKA